MNHPNHHHLSSVVAVLATYLLLLPLGVPAQDARPLAKGLTLAFGARTSPFEPPTTDTFVADSGPGLDTGCTFNDDPEHPLRIDILVDRFVGDVDQNGFLINPDPLIAKGILPTKVAVILPAYDVDIIDINGSPTPEQDEVFLNGERLGLLTGNNNDWKLNSFQVDLRKLKFPAKPPEGASPMPVRNRLQINIDVLNGGWCTAIDWVALVIPIRPAIAVRLESKTDNEIRVNDPNSDQTIETIYQQSVDADCQLKEEIGPFQEFPFSGSILGQTKRLHSKIESCPANSTSSPKVKVEWQINDTSRKGVQTWTGFEGDILLDMPNKVGVYTVDFTYTINNYTLPTISRKLFVTWDAPINLKRIPLRPTVPRLAWYEKATTWAAGETEESEIVNKLLVNLYQFGRNNWRYGYDFGSINKCPWQELVTTPIFCDYSDCHAFSQVFLNMAATLGIGGLSYLIETGSKDHGFVTTVAPSLDPAFRGNARPFSGDYDRYMFGSHSLVNFSRKDALDNDNILFYDATFNGIYFSPTAFIFYNFDGGSGSDTNGEFLTTDEGARVYLREGHVYDSWATYEYTTPSSIPFPNQSIKNAVLNTQYLQFTGNVAFKLVEVNHDGVAKGLTAEVEVNLPTAGSYLLVGTLRKEGQMIANRPAYEDQRFSSAHLNEMPGTYTVSLQFSGEQIFRSTQDGPYDLEIMVIGPNHFSTTTTVLTPAYDHTQFGEVGALITHITDAAVDEDGDGKLDFLEATLVVLVRSTGDYLFQGSLARNVTLVATGNFFSLSPGTHILKLQFPGLTIQRKGVDGPYYGVVNIVDTNEQAVSSATFTTQAYEAARFGVLLEPEGSFTHQGIDTNGNGLFDLLRISFGAKVNQAGTFLIDGVLRSQTSPLAVFTSTVKSLSVGSQTLVLDFSGPLIQEQKLNGPYQVTVFLREPNTAKELDRVTLGQTTAAYQFTNFEPLETTSPISLPGHSSDQGVDTNGNSLFDELQVAVAVNLATTDDYQWSASLTDATGLEIGFDSRAARLTAGTTTINFVFKGELIGQHGVNGPYLVKGLLMFGRQTGSNLVSVAVAQTQAYQAKDFEGFLLRNQPPVARCHNQTVVANDKCQGSVQIDNGSFDPEGRLISLRQQPAGPYPLGNTLVTLTATDDQGAVDSCQATVTVLDKTAPTISNLTTDPKVLWPPNHQMKPVKVTISASDFCEPTPTCQILAVNSNEPTNGLGDGDTFPDWELTSKLTVNLRAERAGTGQGRSYTLTLACTDSSGNSSRQTVDVTVPRDYAPNQKK